MKKLSGIIPPIPTPLKADGTVDEQALRAMISLCIENNFGGVFICGTNGEGMSLPHKQRLNAFKIALDAADGKIAVLGGCMESSTQRVIDCIQDFAALGGKYAVVTPPFYACIKDHSETVHHMHAISQAVDIDVFLYNIPPYVGGYTVPPAVVKEVSTFPHIVGYKDSSGNIDAFLGLLHHFKDSEFMMFQGKATQTALSLYLGADGAIPNVSTVLPKATNDIVACVAAGDLNGALQAQEKLNTLLTALFGLPNIIPAVKYLHARKGLMEEYACQPAQPLTSGQKEMLDQLMPTLEA